jgi:hypothetical protein
MYYTVFSLSENGEYYSFFVLQMITIAYVSSLWNRDIPAIHMIVENIDIRNI